MALVPAKCTQCGANITVDNSLEAAVCEHCGTPFIVEKAVNNYITFINAKSLTIDVGDSADNLAQSALAFINSDDYDSAEPFVKKLESLYISDWRSYYYNMLLITHNFNSQYYEKEYGDDFFSLDKLFNKAHTLAGTEDKKQIYDKYEKFKNDILQIIADREAAEKKRQLDLKEERKQLQLIRHKKIKKILKVLIIAILSLLVVLTAIYYLLKDKIQYNKAFNEESFCIVPALEMYYEISDYAPAKERIELLTPILEYSGDYSDSKGLERVRVFPAYKDGKILYSVAVLDSSIMHFTYGRSDIVYLNNSTKLYGMGNSSRSYATFVLDENKNIQVQYFIVTDWGTDSSLKRTLTKDE